MKKFSFSGKVFVWPGGLGWYFVYLPKDLVEKIKKNSSVHGAGFVKIKATVGKTDWQTSLFPFKRENTFLICIKKSVREKEDVFPGEEIKVSFSLI
ncbi:MAG: hypothetical protein QG580_245 [Patescibacteria group bacterium]|jgi:hypothetical protein|nr:hypothetical protein [Patescibacteria group bacterium]